MPILRLAIASPPRRIFDYLPPPDTDTSILQPGIRVLAPFGPRQVCAVLLEVAENSDLAADKLRSATAILDQQPLISKSLLALCLWAASYYKHSPGQILAAALPTRLRQGKALPAAGEPCWQLTTIGKGLPEGALRRAPRQAELLSLLLKEGTVPQAVLKKRNIPPATIRQLRDKALIERLDIEAPIEPPRTHAGPTLNTEQQVALDTIVAAGSGFACFLLEGVTGSGKTEVYLRLIQRVIEGGGQVLVLVPEIGLTPQTLRRFQARFDANIVTLNSGLSDGERLSAWDAARSGRAAIVLGTRSAVFTSLARPGLVIVDEEHDASFKQQDGFRYSARDLAVKRAQLEDVPVVLGSATPSLESIANARAGRYQRLVLRERAGAGEMPTFERLDIRRSPLLGGMSQPLLDAVGVELRAGNQALLFLNRRGYAPTLQCHDCGFVAGCPHCDARLTLHKRAAELRCHHCDWRCTLPARCPQCQSSRLQPTGVGTEQVESVLQTQFPDTPLYRVDRDVIQRRGAMEEVLAEVNTGAACLLLGTQMLTKGHHFPDVTLVGVLDTDAAMFSADFRGPERMGQLLTQVAGRAGREHKPGRVYLQTHYPDHPLLQVLLDRGYREFAELLLQERQQTGMPPFGFLLLMRAESNSQRSAEDFLGELRQQTAARLDPSVQMIGPLPAPMQRRSGRFRSQLAVTSNNRAAAQSAGDLLVALAEAMPGGKNLRWSLDVDPQDMM
jgi:primosomal protein N' (replication factor Y)